MYNVYENNRRLFILGIEGSGSEHQGETEIIYNKKSECDTQRRLESSVRNLVDAGNLSLKIIVSSQYYRQFANEVRRRRERCTKAPGRPVRKTGRALAGALGHRNDPSESK